MSSNQLIAVIGGTGKSGRHLLQALLNARIPFRLLIHTSPPPAAITSAILPTIATPSSSPGTHPRTPSFQTLTGDARSPQTIHSLCLGCTAIISTLGQPPNQPPVFSQTTRNILHTMQHQNIPRYIVTTGLQVDTPFDQKSPPTSAATRWMQQNYPSTTTDKQLEYETLAASPQNIQWTLVRLPLIDISPTSSPAAGSPILTSLTDCPSPNIHAVSLASFLIAQLTDTQFHRQAPFLANG